MSKAWMVKNGDDNECEPIFVATEAQAKAWKKHLYNITEERQWGKDEYYYEEVEILDRFPDPDKDFVY